MATNTINIQDIIEEGSLKEMFTKRDGDRSSVLDRARNCAKLTIPSIMPDSGSSETSDFVTPYQALGSRLVNNLASKLLLTLLPPNTSFFRLLPPEDLIKAQDPASDAASKIEANLITIEQELMKQIEREALRVPTFDAIKTLIVTGNSLLYKTETGLKSYKLADYVIVRDFSGNPVDIITREELTKDTLPADIISKLPPEDLEKDGKLTLYTRAVNKLGSWYEYQMVESTLVDGSEATYKDSTKLPYIPLRWTAISGENYGRGLVEQYIGDFRSLEALYQLVLENCAISARTIFGKKPGSVIDIEDLNGADNGSCISGDLENDITVLRVEKNSDMQSPLQMIQDLTRRLEQAFLVASSATRDSERTTATEIRYMAGDLEESLGGLYSILSLEYQRPLANLLLQQSKIDIKSVGVDIVIVTGIEALGRNLELDKLRQFNKLLQELGSPEIVLQRMNIDNYIAMIGNALSLDTANLIKSAEQIQAEQQQQATDGLMQQGASNMVQNATMPQQQ